MVIFLTFEELSDKTTKIFMSFALKLNEITKNDLILNSTPENRL